jgi:hypothetical protein
MPKKLQVGLWLALILIALAIPAGVLAKTTAQGTGNAFVMVGNFSPNSSPVNIYINGALLGRSLSFSQATFPATVKAGEIFIEIRSASNNALIVNGYKTVNANDYYMVPFMNTVERAQFGAYRIPVYETLGTTETRVQFFHAVPRGPRLDVFTVAGTGNTVRTEIIDAMGYVEDPRIVDRIPAGTYRYQVWTDYRTLFPGAIFDPNPQPDRLVMDLGSLALRARVIYSFFIIGSNSGAAPGNLALVLAMPYGGGAPVAPPGGPGTASGGPVVAQRSVTPGPSPTPTRTPTATPTNTPTPTPTPVPPRVSFTSGVFGVTEGQIAGLTLSMDRTWPSAIAVTYSFVTGGTASNADIGSPSSGTVTFNPGETSKFISLAAAQDTTWEPQESMIIQLTSLSSPAQFGSPSTTFLLINDDDPVPTLSVSANPLQVTGGSTTTLTVTLSNPAYTNVSANLIPVASGGTDPAASEWSLSTSTIFIPAGSTSQTITLSTTSVLADKTLKLELDGVSGGVSGEGNSVIVTIRAATPTPPPTVPPAPTAVPPPAVATLTTVPAAGNIAEGTAVTLTVSLSYIPATGATVTVQTTNGSATFNANDIQMPATPGFGIGCSGTTCTIPFNTGDPLSKSFVITIRDDGVCPTEAAETFNFTITNSTNANIGTPFTHAFTINGDGSPATPCP